MNGFVRLWNCPGRFGIPIPGGARGMPGHGTPGLGDRLDFTILEASSSNSTGFCGTKGNLAGCSWGRASPTHPGMTHPKIPQNILPGVCFSRQLLLPCLAVPGPRFHTQSGTKKGIFLSLQEHLEAGILSLKTLGVQATDGNQNSHFFPK